MLGAYDDKPPKRNRGIAHLIKLYFDIIWKKNQFITTKFLLRNQTKNPFKKKILGFVLIWFYKIS